ncbi:YfcE family phosphodiesterase [Candidatus Woesearchaeota archaeon]|nr:YfcE family phosphodiesterase [Candidatus Woesearchaeota archaeon]
MIALIADTHDNTPLIEKAVRLIKAEKPDFVLHLGDICAPASVLLFQGLPMRFIHGNCDGHLLLIAQRIKEINGLFYESDFAEFSHEGKRFAAYHGTNPVFLDLLMSCGQYDYVLHGHDHKRRDGKVKKTRVINPGAFYPRNIDKPTVAFLHPRTGESRFVEL